MASRIVVLDSTTLLEFPFNITSPTKKKKKENKNKGMELNRTEIDKSKI